MQWLFCAYKLASFGSFKNYNFYFLIWGLIQWLFFQKIKSGNDRKFEHQKIGTSTPLTGSSSASSLSSEA